MAKRQSFADKASKKIHEKICPVCGQPLKFTLVVKPEPTIDGQSFRMRSKHVGICKCNEKSVLA